MNKLLIALATLITVSFESNATADSLINSGKCIAKAKQLVDSGKYDLAIIELDRIDPRDTNYIYSLSEKAKALFENQQYAKALEVCEQALKMRSPYRASLFHSMALGYTAQDKFEQALTSLDEALKEFPFDYSLMYRYGLILYDQGKFDAAEERFFKTIDLTPFHMGSHLYLSKIAMRKGNKVEGMFAMGLYLALNNQENTQLQILENFVKNELTDEQTIAQGSFINPFSRLDEIIRAKFSYEDEYKVKIPIDIGIVRQYQLLFEQLGEQNYPPDGPWVKFYLKIYQDVIKAGGQEPFVYHILQSSPIPKVKQWTESNEKTLQHFYTTINGSLNQFRSPRALPEKWGYSNPVSCTYDDNSHIESLGNKDKANMKTGKWYYFESNGEVLAEGNYTKDKKVGVWRYFNDSRILTSVEDYDNGEIKIFDADGAVIQHYFLKDSRIDGNFQLFYPCGAINESRSYYDGKRNGPGKNYFPNGKLKTEFNFKDDSLDGPFVKWYDSGIKESEMSYKAGSLNGRYQSYHPNGKPKSIGHYSSGRAEGQWFYYHENGRLKQKGNYKSDTLAGTWETYNERGVLLEKRSYEQREGFNEEAIFFHEGLRHYVMHVNKDKIIGLTYHNKSGAVIAEYSDNQGTFKGRGLFPTGELQVELEYEKGVRSGQWKHYSRYGFLQTVANYQEGRLHGENLEYYSSGALKVKSNYVEGKLDGLFTEYHSNGKIKSVGWYQDGQRQQRWLDYYIDGSLESDTYYLNDVATGYRLEFSETKKLLWRSEYDLEGRKKNIIRYNEDGIQSPLETVGNQGAAVVQKNNSGGISYKSEFTCGEWNGPTNVFLSSGKLYRKFNYSNGNLHGEFASYYPDGSIDGIGQYAQGSPTGVWKWNNIDGSRYCEGGYMNGGKDSVWTYFYYNGKMSNLNNFLNNEKDGEVRVFGLDGQLVFVKKYDLGDLVAYQAAGKDGKLSDWTPFTGNETLVSYYANGKLAIVESYKNGQFHGIRKAFYPNGQLYNSYEYDNGVSIGQGLLYYSNGKLKQKSFYESDQPTGKWEYFDVNGVLLQRETYRSGSLDGKVEFFSNGKVSKVQNYFGGFPLD